MWYSAPSVSLCCVGKSERQTNGDVVGDPLVGISSDFKFLELHPIPLELVADVEALYVEACTNLAAQLVEVGAVIAAAHVLLAEPAEVVLAGCGLGMLFGHEVELVVQTEETADGNLVVDVVLVNAVYRDCSAHVGELDLTTSDVFCAVSPCDVYTWLDVDWKVV